MTLFRLLLRNLRYFWRANLAVAAGAAVATAVLVGALLVGDSVRGSLRAIAVQRLGRTDFALVAPTPFDIVFLDPPYSARVLPRACTLLEAGGWLKPGAHIYLEDAAAAGEPALPPGWRLMRSKRAGEVGYYLARRE